MGRCVGGRCELLFGAVGGSGPGMGGVTTLGRTGVLEFVEGGWDILGHGNVKMFVG